MLKKYFIGKASRLIGLTIFLYDFTKVFFRDKNISFGRIYVCLCHFTFFFRKSGDGDRTDEVHEAAKTRDNGFRDKSEHIGLDILGGESAADREQILERGVGTRRDSLPNISALLLRQCGGIVAQHGSNND